MHKAARTRLTYCRRRAPAWSSTPRNQILLGDALAVLRTLPTAGIDAVVTSPAYFRLRNYGSEGQMGMEATVEEWVDHLAVVCQEISRVIRPTGSLWLNLGDSFSRHHSYGAAPKSLLLGPERLLLRLLEDGWIIRNKIVWAKANPMPSSVRDRLTTTWEPMFLLVRSPDYFFDLDAIRAPHASSRRPTNVSPGAKYNGGRRPSWAGPLAGSNGGLLKARAEGRAGHPLGKNPGDVWTVATASFAGQHFATFPARLIDRPIRASCPERVCAACGRPWKRQAGSLHARCRCKAAWKPGLVLDPFIGAGTTAVVAEQLGRDWLGIEINPDYAAIADNRIHAARSSGKGVNRP